MLGNTPKTSKQYLGTIEHIECLDKCLWPMQNFLHILPAVPSHGQIRDLFVVLLHGFLSHLNELLLKVGSGKYVLFIGGVCVCVESARWSV